MSLGPIMMDLVGYSLSELESQQIQEGSVGGIILFKRNYKNKTQLVELVREIRSIKPNILISVDHEGGRVWRFEDGFTKLPAMGIIGRIHDEDVNKAYDLAYSCGFVMASELLEVGIDFSFAPVLDLDYGTSKVIGDRAFHSDPNVVSNLAKHFIKGMADVGMKAVGKHYPGHGFVVPDSHHELPVDSREMSEIEFDLIAFKELVDYGLGGIMPAHIIYENCHSDPAGFSSFWLKDILRKKLNFEGVIFSDDLSMAGAKFISQIEARVDAAIEAGCNMVLVCNHPEELQKVVARKYSFQEGLTLMKGNLDAKVFKMDYSKHIQQVKNYE